MGVGPLGNNCIKSIKNIYIEIEKTNIMCLEPEDKPFKEYPHVLLPH